MNSRNYIVTSVVLVIVAAGAWWALSGKNYREAADSHAVPSNEIDPQPAIPPSPVPPAPTVVEDQSAASEAVEPQAITTPPQKQVEWEARFLAFANQDDPNPDLSRQIESSIEKNMTAALHPNKFDVPRVTCRADRCQILSIEWVSPSREFTLTEGRPNLGDEWGIAFGKAMQVLMDDPVHDPGTGEPLKPMLETVTIIPGESARYAAQIRFRSARQ